MNQRLFISDLHLAPERPEIIHLFVRFCREIASHCHTLYILGDFVEYWLGDDDDASGLQPAFDALHKLAEHGTQTLFMHGNRDFLIGDTLAARCNFKIIPDPSIIQLDQQAALLMHGDTLCTDDVDYMKFRSMVRDPGFQKDFLAKPLQQRRQIARSMRESSQLATAEKKPEIMDVNQAAVEKAMQQHDVNLLIHGHTHRPSIHQFDIQTRHCTRVVLADWYETGSYLVLDKHDTPVLMDFV